MSHSELDLLNEILGEEVEATREVVYTVPAVVKPSSVVDDDDEFETLTAEERSELAVDASGGYPKLTMNNGILLNRTTTIKNSVTGYLVDVQENYRLSWNEPNDSKLVRKVEDALVAAGFDLDVLLKPHQIVRENWREAVKPGELSAMDGTLDLFKKAAVACDSFVYSFKPFLTVLLHVTCLESGDEEAAEILNNVVEVQIPVTSSAIFKAAWAGVVRQGKVPLNLKAIAAGKEPKVKFIFKMGAARQNDNGKDYRIWSITTNA